MITAHGVVFLQVQISQRKQEHINLETLSTLKITGYHSTMLIHFGGIKMEILTRVMSSCCNTAKRPEGTPYKKLTNVGVTLQIFI